MGLAEQILESYSKEKTSVNENAIQDQYNKLSQSIAKQVSKLPENQKSTFLYGLINDLHGNPLTKDYMPKN